MRISMLMPALIVSLAKAASSRFAFASVNRALFFGTLNHVHSLLVGHAPGRCQSLRELFRVLLLYHLLVFLSWFYSGFYDQFLFCPACIAGQSSLFPFAFWFSAAQIAYCFVAGGVGVGWSAL